MSCLKLAAGASFLLLAACGAQPAKPPGDDAASLIRGSWTCSLAGRNPSNGESATETSSISFVSDGTWAANSEWKSGNVEIGVASRGTWKVVDGALHRTFTYYAATRAKIGGEILDHGELNRAAQTMAVELPMHDPLKSTVITTFTKLTTDRMVGADNAATTTTCERLKA